MTVSAQGTLWLRFQLGQLNRRGHVIKFWLLSNWHTFIFICPSFRCPISSQKKKKDPLGKMDSLNDHTRNAETSGSGHMIYSPNLELFIPNSITLFFLFFFCYFSFSSWHRMASTKPTWLTSKAKPAAEQSRRQGQEKLGVQLLILPTLEEFQFLDLLVFRR